jgi:hypothetical protein
MTKPRMQLPRETRANKNRLSEPKRSQTLVKGLALEAALLTRLNER